MFVESLSKALSILLAASMFYSSCSSDLRANNCLKESEQHAVFDESKIEGEAQTGLLLDSCADVDSHVGSENPGKEISKGTSAYSEIRRNLAQTDGLVQNEPEDPETPNLDEGADDESEEPLEQPSDPEDGAHPYADEPGAETGEESEGEAETTPPEEPLETDPDTENTQEEEQDSETEEEQDSESEEEQDPELFDYEYCMEIQDDFVAPFAEWYTAYYALGNGMPSSYDSRSIGIVSPVKDQQELQLCWAFSVAAVAESFMMSNGNSTVPDYSEMHLGYFFARNSYDPLGNSTGDSTRFIDNYTRSGNNNKFTTFALANWIGLADENQYPYNVQGLTGVTDECAVDDTVHMSNAYWINAQDTYSIKQNVMANGAVGISIYYAQRFLDTANSSYYNSYYTATNHSVCIVGWDDSFPASSFRETPEGDGAWLIKNSVGTEFCDEGYFWLSYYDAAINYYSATAFVFEFQSADNYDNNYHYDGSCGTKTYYIPDEGAIANVFTASASDNGKDEELCAVSVAIADANVDYSVQIYTNLVNPDDPESGTPMLEFPQTGCTGLCGIYTIELDSPVILQNGTDFSVVITLSKYNSSVNFFTDETYNNGSWISFECTTRANQSFCTDSNGHWADLSSRGKTARIKAFTNQLDSRILRSLSFEENPVSVINGGTYCQQPIKTPTDCDAVQLVWSSSDESVAEVDSTGMITAKAVGTTIISASTEDGSIAAGYNLNVTPGLNSVSFTRFKSTMMVGDRDIPEYYVLPSQYASYYSPVLSSSDENVARIEDDTVVGVAQGTARISILVGNKTDSYNLTVKTSIATAEVQVPTVIFSGAAASPTPVVLLNGTELELDIDFTVSYSDNLAPGKGSVIVSGTGAYSGEVSSAFDIIMPTITVENAKNTAQGIELSWTSNGAYSFCEIQSQKNSGSWKKIKTADSVSRLYVDTGATASGGEYAYRLRPAIKVGTKTFYGDYSQTTAAMRLSAAKITELGAAGNGINIRWRAVTGANAYRIIKTEAEGTPINITLTVDDTEYTDEDVLTDTMYTYSVVPLRIDGAIEQTGPSSLVKSALIPASPSGLSASNTAKGVMLDWDDVSTASGYYVYRNGVQVASVKTSKYEDTRAHTSGTTYSYTVNAFAEIDKTVFMGADSAEATNQMFLSKPVIKRTTVHDDSIELLWKPVTGADSYGVYRDGTYLATTPNEYYLDNEGLTQNSTYVYEILAMSSSGADTWTSAATQSAGIRYQNAAIQSSDPDGAVSGQIDPEYIERDYGEDIGSPRTGDSSDIGILLSVNLISGCFLCLLTMLSLLRKKRQTGSRRLS